MVTKVLPDWDGGFHTPLRQSAAWPSGSEN